MNCLACRGACCESFSIPAKDLQPPGGDERRWLELHATREATLAGPYLAFECRCTALTAEGRCGIYEDRPIVCKMYEPGGADCLATVRARRTPEQYQAIRDASDPEALHP